MYRPRQRSRTLPWAKCQIFLEALFICNNINTNLNKNFHTLLCYHSFKPLVLFIQISVGSSSKKFEDKKWPKAGYLPLLISKIKSRTNFFPYFCFSISLERCKNRIVSKLTCAVERG